MYKIQFTGNAAMPMLETTMSANSPPNDVGHMARVVAENLNENYWFCRIYDPKGDLMCENKIYRKAHIVLVTKDGRILS